MKLWGIFRFELAYQARRPWPWLFFLVLLVLDFLMARDAALADALYEDFFVDSPFAIASTTVFGGLIWLLVAPVVAGEAAARDVGTRMHPLTYTSSVRTGEYLGGRFLAALALNALILLAVPLGFLLGVHSPGVDARVLGPFRPSAYLGAYALLALPNAFVGTALQFSLAARSGRAMASYLGSLLLCFMGFFVASVVLFRHALGTLVDPIGIRFVVEDLAHRWTTAERNTRLLALEGDLLANRLLWVGLAAGALALTFARFRFAHRAESPWWTRWTRRRETRAPRPEHAGTGADAPVAVVAPGVRASSGAGIQLRKTLAIARQSFRAVATSPAGLATLVGLPLLTVPVVLDQLDAAGIPVVATTARVLAELTAPLSAELSRWVIVPLLLVFFAGELVWREREARVHEITDAMPGSEWAPLLGKLLGLALVLALLMAMLTLSGALAQLASGRRALEIGLSLRVMLGLQLAEYLLFALLALVVHVVVNEKYVGHLVAILAYVFVAVLAPMLGVEHNLLVYGGGPPWAYTEMRGFGGSVGPWLWFKLSWPAWPALLALAARLLWVRGREHGLRTRRALARRRLALRSSRVVGAAAAAAVVALGGWIYYNTNVRNAYLGTAEAAERRAEYERRYGRYAGAAQPRLTAVSLRVELHPARRAAEVRGVYRLVNEHARAIDTIHVSTATGGAETRAITFDRPATLVVDDAAHRYRIYALRRPLTPGDSLRLDFVLRAGRRGFGNRGLDPALTARGSYFTSGAWFPFVGYQRQRELVTASARRSHALPARPVIASLYEASERPPAARGGGIAFEAVIGTDAGQTAVAPGDLRRAWTEGGRRYFHYVADAPIGTEWSFFSARYAVHEGRWNAPGSAPGRGVAIRIFHHPGHAAHLARTMRSVRASLDYFTAQLGPYPYGHLTVVEHPGAPGTGLHADASMLSHGEGFPHWLAPDEPGALDFPSAVVAHEMAHQWTLPYAAVEGAPFLSEGLAWYGAMQAVRASRGEAELRRLLAAMRRPDAYPPIRRGEPLLRALDPYLSYRRGPFAMYALSEHVGADRVNLALRRLVARHDSAGAPLATTLDLYRELRAVTPDSLRPLLRDLFEVNTLWQLETRRATAARAADGAWRVTLEVRARKLVYDSAGVERDVPMDQWIPVGVFEKAAEGGERLGRPLHVRLHRLRAGAQTITVTVPREPALAGVDPYHLLDWEERDGDDNVRAVDVGATPGRTP